jgi:peptidoglycan/xylan/chitin deacetylase (PgdA/CDA1 family)
MKRALGRLAPEALVFHGARSGPPRIALTFDDGPEALTPRYLDVLDRFGVSATFFVVGSLVERRSEMLRAMIERGHEVAGHGYTHDPFPALAAPVLASELLLTQDLLPPSLLAKPIVRPPRGNLSVRSVLHTMLIGFTSVVWSVDSDDCRTKDARVVESRLAPERLRAGDIVLLHEGQPWTLEALPAVLGRLADAGFELVTVSRLLDRRLP